MTDMTDYLENEALDHIFGKAARNFTSPPVLAVSLHSADPTEVGNVAELANSNGYSRQAVTFAAAASGSTKNSGTVTFTATGGAWTTASHCTVVDTTTYGTGNVLMYGALTASKKAADGDSISFAVNDLDLQFA